VRGVAPEQGRRAAAAPQRRRFRAEAEGSARRRAWRCTCTARCRTAATRFTLVDGVALRCSVWTRRPNTHRPHADALFGPADRALHPRQAAHPAHIRNQTDAGLGASVCEHERVRRLPATLPSPSDVGRIGGASDQPRACKQGHAGLPDRLRCWPGHATPFGVG
jgi:hypothetical protein